MTKENAKEFLKRGILQAFAEGKTIQFADGGGWRDLNEYAFDSRPEKYRIKPEPRPREFWVNVYEGATMGALHTSKLDADHCVTKQRLECLHVREVL